MTYLNLVNGVLRRLREDEVSNVSESTFSKMVGDFVNDAKDIVETAWDWSPLRSTLTITTSADDNLYSITGSRSEGKILNLINDTSNLEMQYQTQNWFDDKEYIQEAVTGAPQYYTYSGVDGSDDTQIKIYPTPDKAYTLRARVVLRNIALSSDSDTLAIPSAPVLHMAIALLARERGETGGTSTAEYFNIADKHLSDAIALDAQKHPEETIFYTP
jgi:hypothetical protein